MHRDLLDVCQAQQQFAPAEPLTTFGGPKGVDVTASLLGIQARRVLQLNSRASSSHFGEPFFRVVSRTGFMVYSCFSRLHLLACGSMPSQRGPHAVLPPDPCNSQTDVLAQALYQKLLVKLRELPYSALNVACTAWYAVNACWLLLHRFRSLLYTCSVVSDSSLRNQKRQKSSLHSALNITMKRLGAGTTTTQRSKRA